MVLIRGKRRWLSSQAKCLAETAGVSDPEEAMRKLVANLLEEAQQDLPPINLPLVASFRGITSIRPEAIAGQAMLVPTSRGLEIIVNSSDIRGRRNFSIAHEVCHTFFPDAERHISGIDNFIGRFSIKQEEEYLCDVGASRLLIPHHLLSARIKYHGCCLDAIIRLADVFGASIEATAIAWAQVSPWPCAVVFLEEKLKPSQIPQTCQTAFPGMEDVLPQPELRVSHAYNTRRFPIFFPKDKSVSREGLIYRCMIEGQTSGIDTLEFQGQLHRIHTESIYSPYHKDGQVRSRVVSLIRAP